MVRAEKLQHALCALNRVLVLLRDMAYRDSETQELAEILDVAEYLPRLLADNTDCTDAFKDQLVYLARRWPMFSSALRVFEDPDLSTPW